MSHLCRCPGFSTAVWLALLVLAEAVQANPVAPESALPAYEPCAPLRGKLASVGTNTMDVITFGWVQLFREAHPDVSVTIEARSSLTAAPALTNGLADVAPVGREFLPSETALFREKFGYEPTLIRVASGSFARNNRSHALAVYVHRDNPLQRLTLAEIDAIYSTTRRRGHPREILTWGDLGLDGEWAKRPVTVYSIRRPNGISNFFQNRVLLGGEYRPGIRERANSSDRAALASVVEAVGADPGGIGFAGFGHATPDVRALELSENGGGPWVAGTPDTVADRSYPLARWVYIAVNKSPERPLSPVVSEFLRLVLSREGQAVIARQGDFLPLPADVAQEELLKLE